MTKSIISNKTFFKNFSITYFLWNLNDKPAIHNYAYEKELRNSLSSVRYLSE